MWICVCEGVGLVFLFALVLGFFFLCVVLSLLEKNFVLMIIIFNDYDDRLEIFKHPYSHSTFIKGYSSFFLSSVHPSKNHKQYPLFTQIFCPFFGTCCCSCHLPSQLHLYKSYSTVPALNPFYISGSTKCCYNHFCYLNVAVLVTLIPVRAQH